MKSVVTGGGNTSIGYSSMINADSSTAKNVVIGGYAGRYTTGGGNVFIGYEAGENNIGYNNIFIGYTAGYNSTWQNVNNRLIINSGYSNPDTPLIYGEFDNKVVKITDVLQLAPRSSVPINPTEGTIYVNSTSHHIFCFLNGNWKQLDN
jgi:hypothetical protein